jgi:hypothetical protein
MANNRNHFPAPPVILTPEPSALRKQGYGSPWTPGEIPNPNARGNVGSLISVHASIEDPPKEPYEEYLGVEKPHDRGRKYPLKAMSVEGMTSGKITKEPK